MQETKINNIMAKKLLKRKATSSLPKSLLKEARWVVKNRWTLLSTIPQSAHYAMQENMVTSLFSKSFPTNTNIHEVITKASTLNLFYSTHVTAIPLLANDIISIPNIDIRLKSGDLTLVPDIANAGNKQKTYRSFATKYCACHNPKAYPIYDRIVRKYLAEVISKGNLPPYSESVNTIIQNMMNSYAYYVKVYDAFIKMYHLSSMTYRQVDLYIWVAHKSKISARLSNLDLFNLI